MIHQPLIHFGESLIGEGNEDTRGISDGGKRRGSLEFIRLYMVRQGQQLLQYTDLTVDDIAEHCGFRNNSNLTQSFTPIAGVPPRMSRRQHQRRLDRGRFRVK